MALTKSELRELRRAVDEHGFTRTAKMVGIAEATLAKIIAELDTHTSSKAACKLWLQARAMVAAAEGGE